MRRSLGIGLLELLISVALSLGVLLLLTAQWVQVKRQALYVSNVMDQSLELQWLTELLRSRVRSAGYTPCLRLDHLIAVDTRRQAQSLAGIAWHATPHAESTLQRMGDEISPVLRQINSHEIVIQGHGIALKRPIMLADCTHAEVHSQARHFAASDGVHVILNEPLQFTYQSPAYYAEWMTESFSMRTRENGEPALFYQRHRVDLLSTQIVDFSMHIITAGLHTWVEWTLTRTDGQRWTVLTRVRSA